MIDRDVLRPWIAARHLDDTALERYRGEMAAHPARMIVLTDVLTDDAATTLASFLGAGAEFGLEHGLYSHPGAEDQEVWEAAPEPDRFFRYGKLAGIRPEAALDPPTLTYMKWRTFVTEPAFHDFFEALTGLTLGESDDFGVHRFSVGDFLKEHDDENKNRRVAFVMYLTPHWRREFGGALHMKDRSGDVHLVESMFNTMVLFDVAAGSTHHVGKIEEVAGEHARLTFGGWFPNPS
jgi:2OG-Fe(II) oxygenase superfamily